MMVGGGRGWGMGEGEGSTIGVGGKKGEGVDFRRVKQGEVAGGECNARAREGELRILLSEK